MWKRYVAIGDSFTEGLMDEARDDGRHRGWADRLAQKLADHAAVEGLASISYANVAIRGRLLADVMSQQVPVAEALKPDLVSLAAGVNDCLRREFPVAEIATDLEVGVRRLTEGGAHVLLFAYGDPSRRSRVLGRIKERIVVLNAITEDVAQRYGCDVVRYWDAAVMDDDRLWDADRLHLSPRGHALAAESAWEALGLGSAQWRTPLAPGPHRGPIDRAGSDLAWLKAHALPWIGRRLRGRSSGDSVTPKNPQWVTVTASG
ncbi:MAG: SGNH/GDSL hydrolase family protein [Actinomycetes bacterium]